ncbi:MAG: prepilin peptidase, partial [Candidatus Eremiobacterota bacterium]
MAEAFLEPILLLSSVNPFSLLVVFLFGSVFGSFLNVVIYRTPLERSVVLPGSACTVCGTPLRWWHNVPILSYFLLHGRCYFCGSGFSARYMLMEAFVAAAAALLFAHFGCSVAFLHAFALFFLATAVFFTDLDHWIIPDQVNFAGMALGLVLSLWMPPTQDFSAFQENLSLPVWALNLLSSALGILIGLLFFWAIQVVGTLLARQEAMGGGDVKFAGLLGAFLGWKMALLAFLLSFFLGALVAIPLMLLRRGRGKEPIPFGTFMA